MKSIFVRSTLCLLTLFSTFQVAHSSQVLSTSSQRVADVDLSLLSTTTTEKVTLAACTPYPFCRDQD